MVAIKEDKFETKGNSTTLKRQSYFNVGLCILFATVLLFTFPNVVRDYFEGIILHQSIYIPDNVYVNTDTNENAHVLTSFRVFNLRPKPLDIKIEPGCGCIAVSLDHAHINPFSWCSFTASAELDGRITNSDKSIVVHTNDANKTYVFAFIRNSSK